MGVSRILGIDPGSRVTGYGVIDSARNQHQYITSGCICTQQKAFPDRLGEIFDGIRAILQQTQPTQVAIEQIFVANSALSALKLGQARGAAITAVVTLDLPVHEYTPRTVKQSLVGSGGATKEQVQHMVRILLARQQKMSLDESDALAIALCHAHTYQTRQKLKLPI
jgi:crossover junction endodeoxyribonuclease RuvC